MPTPSPAPRPTLSVSSLFSSPLFVGAVLEVGEVEGVGVDVGVDVGVGVAEVRLDVELELTSSTMNKSPLSKKSLFPFWSL
jgi:hypothetical protein